MKNKDKKKLFLVTIFFVMFIFLFSKIYHRNTEGEGDEDVFQIKVYSYDEIRTIKYTDNESVELMIKLNYTPPKVLPFWFWNGNLTKKEITRQIDLMDSKGIEEVMIHARVGLEQEYLSEEWFYFVGHALQELEKRNMNAWIYDEIDWPSGRAGGKVLEKNPELIGKNLKIESIRKDEFRLEQNKNYPVKKIISVIILETKQPYNVKEKFCSELYCNFSSLPNDSEKHIFYQDLSHFETLYSKEKYVDVLDPETTEIFIDITYDEYYQRYEEYFGETIIGFFTDEPGFYNNIYGAWDLGSIPWTEGFSEEFQEKKGYDIKDYLYYVWYDDQSDLSENVKQDYFEVLTDTYSKNYFKKLHDWTYSHDVLLTGHLLQEEDLYDTIGTQGDFFTHMNYFDILGTDDIIFFNENKITPSLVSSAEVIYNKPYSLTESFAGYSWDMTYDEMLNVTKWLLDNGVDIIVPHAFFYSVEGETRYNDYPPSLFFQNDKIWHNFSDYITFVESNKKKTDMNNLTVIVYPIEEAWRRYDPRNRTSVNELDILFSAKLNQLREKNINFIVVPDYMIENEGKI